MASNRALSVLLLTVFGDVTCDSCLRETCTGEPISMVMTASSYRSLPGTTVEVAGRRDSKTSFFALVCLAQAQVRDQIFPSLPYIHDSGAG